MSRDMMANFELYQPDSVDNAVDLLGRFGEDGWAMAGGHDTLDWFKDRAKYAANVVDLSGIAELSGIRETATGIEIGALTTLTEIEQSPLIQERYSVLSDAARRVASPQIRNTGTLGGNVNGLLSCRRHHLLRGYTGRTESRTLLMGCRSLRRRLTFGYRTGAGCIRRPHGRA